LLAQSGCAQVRYKQQKSLQTGRRGKINLAAPYAIAACLYGDRMGLLALKMICSNRNESMVTEWTRRTWLTFGLIALVPVQGQAQTTNHASAMQQMKTHSIGRHLVDLPDGFEALAGNRVDLYFGLDADASKITASLLARLASSDEFLARVRKRLADLAAERHDVLDKPMLIRDKASADGKLHLIRSYKNDLLSDVYRSEVFCRVGTAIAHLETRSGEGHADETERHLLGVAARISGPPEPASAGRGFAVEPFLIAADHAQEIGTLNFKSAAAPDVLITMRINALTPNPEPGLLGRWDRNFSAFLRAVPGAPSTIRRGAIPIGGMAGDELLTKAQMNGRRVLKLNAESRRDKPGLATPLLSLVCDTEPVGPADHWPQPVWSEEETIKIWDEITRSIRLRPGSV
jgi:hypothetical protein